MKFAYIYIYIYIYNIYVCVCVCVCTCCFCCSKRRKCYILMISNLVFSMPYNYRCICFCVTRVLDIFGDLVGTSSHKVTEDIEESCEPTDWRGRKYRKRSEKDVYEIIIKRKPSITNLKSFADILLYISFFSK